MIEIKSKKIDNGYLFHDALTNDPIAIVKDISSRWHKSKLYSIAWHPDARLMHPETHHLSNMNIGSVSGLIEAKDKVANRYSDMLNGVTKDPIETKYAGTSTKEFTGSHNQNHVLKYDDYHIHHDGVHIATLHIQHTKTSSIGTDQQKYEFDDKQHQFDPKFHAYVEFHGETPSPEKLRISQLKHPGADPIALLHQVKHWVENKDKEPKFVGHVSYDGFKSFKTPLSPEKASDEYWNHMQSNDNYKFHQFTRLTPTVFQAVRHRENNYDAGSHELIDASEQGKLKHYTIKTQSDTHYTTKPNTQVIE